MPSSNLIAVADTGYLLAFGSIPGGGRMLYSLYDHDYASPPAVIWELMDLCSGSSRDVDVMHAACEVLRTFGVPIATLDADDIRVRESIWTELGGGLTRGGSEAVVMAPGGTQIDTISGLHAGESEAMALAIQPPLRLLINDAKARGVAAGWEISVEPSPVSMKALVGEYSPQQLFEMHKKMDHVARSNVAVSGPLWFQGG